MGIIPIEIHLNNCYVCITACQITGGQILTTLLFRYFFKAGDNWPVLALQDVSWAWEVLVWGRDARTHSSRSHEAALNP